MRGGLHSLTSFIVYYLRKQGLQAVVEELLRLDLAEEETAEQETVAAADAGSL